MNTERKQRMNRLKQLRKQANLTVRELCDYVNISHSVLAYLENEVRPFRQLHIDRLTSFFNVTSDYLLGRSDYGYIVFPQYGNDQVILSENEYSRLGEYITLSIIKNKLSLDITIKDKKQEETINMPNYCIYRELKGELNDYDMKETLCAKLQEMTKRMAESDLRKTISFIEEYIFK